MRRVGKFALTTALILVTGGAAFWWLTTPQRVDASILAAMGEGDAARGEQVFWAGGCASCHAAPGATGDGLLSLAGGVTLDTDFGTFVAPNISQDPVDGIGDWTAEDLANAMLLGVSPQGSHYYPAFPYASYAKMDPSDIADLYAFLTTLPAVDGRPPDSDIAFPYNIRRGLGLWKQLNVDDGPVVALEGASEEVLRGQYLVEGAGHCGECHTPRAALGGLDMSRWLAGASAAEGDGTVPNITTGPGGIGDWTQFDIANLLETGFTPDFDSVGGSMAAVVRHMAQLPQSDRDAIAAYLMAIPGHPDAD